MNELAQEPTAAWMWPLVHYLLWLAIAASLELFTSLVNDLLGHSMVHNDKESDLLLSHTKQCSAQMTHGIRSHILHEAVLRLSLPMFSSSSWALRPRSGILTCLANLLCNSQLCCVVRSVERTNINDGNQCASWQ
eukprot:1524272-Amphidinium_carterae.1